MFAALVEVGWHRGLMSGQIPELLVKVVVEEELGTEVRPVVYMLLCT